MNQEQTYLTALESASSYVIHSTTMTMTTASGPLVYSAGVATPALAPVAAR